LHDLGERPIHFGVELECAIGAARQVPVECRIIFGGGFIMKLRKTGGQEAASPKCADALPPKKWFVPRRIPVLRLLPDLGFPGRLYSLTHLATEVENLGIRQRPCSSTDSDNACSSSLETSGVIWAMSASLGFVYRSPGLRSDAMTILPNRRQSPGHGNRGCLFTFAALNLKD
jgi:hypothetical protein